MCIFLNISSVSSAPEHSVCSELRKGNRSVDPRCIAKLIVHTGPGVHSQSNAITPACGPCHSQGDTSRHAGPVLSTPHEIESNARAR